MIAKALQEKAPKSAPNNSVAIFFEKKPTVSMVTFMKDRAYKFAAAKRKMAEYQGISYEVNFKLTIHGFRLVKETTTETEEEI